MQQVADRRQETDSKPQSTADVDPLRPPEAEPLVDPLAQGPIFLRAVSSAPSGDPERAFGDATAGGGTEVPYRQEMEQAFSRDFSDVQAHTGQAGPMASLGAEAATRGDRVAFRDTHPTRETVAHELAHVAQGPGNGGGVAPASSSAEREADRVASAVVSGGSADVSAAPGGGIHLRKVTGPAGDITVDDTLNAEAFRKATWVRFATRGDHLKRIEDFLDLVAAAQDVDSLRYATEAALDAIAGWEEKHAGDTGGSVEKRRPGMNTTKGKLTTLKSALPPATGGTTPPTPTTSPGGYDTASGHVDEGGPQAPDEEEYEAPVVGEVGDQLLGTGANAMGLPGGSSDITGDKKTSYKDLGDNAKFGIGEGSVNTAAGLWGIGTGLHQLANGKNGVEKAKGGLKAAGGAGTTVGGIAKIVSSAQKGADPTSDTAGVGAGKVSDGALGVAGALSAVSEVTDFFGSLGDAKDWDKWSKDQAINFLVARGQNLIAATKGTFDAVNGFTKMATTTASTAAATGSAVAGIVTGSVEVLHGGFNLIKAGVRKGDLTKLQKTMDTTITGVEEHLREVPAARVEARKKAREVRLAMAGMTDESLRKQMDRIAKSFDDKVTELNTQESTLNRQLTELRAAKDELTPHIEAMRKVQNRAQAKAGFKMATGALDIATGALVLSGVGAPIAIGLAVFTGLLRLGNFALDTGRKWKASKLGELAQRIRPDGTIQGKADPQEVGYREMERRVENAYYKNYAAAIDGDAKAPGFSKGEWGDVRDFVQEAKKADAEKDWGTRQAAAAGGGSTEARSKWGKFADGKKVKAEKPSGFRKVDLFFTFSAHKSEQAMDASNGELANAVIDIAMGSFDPGTKSFVPTQVSATDPAKGVRAMAAKTMLGNIGVSESTWMAMWRKTGGWFAGDPDGSGGNRADNKGPNRDALVADVKKKISSL